MSRPDHDSPTTGAPTVGRDATCEGCGYNLRGVRMGARCPECGLAVSKSIRRRAQDAPDAREEASDAIRTASRSWLLMVPLGAFAMGGCLAGPASALAILGAIQRMLGLRACARTLRGLELRQPSLERVLMACTVGELALGGLGLLLRIAGGGVPPAVTTGVCGLHFGMALLSAVPATGMLAAVGHAADAGDDAPRATDALPWLFGASALLAVAIALLGIGVLGGIAWVLMLAGAASWAWGTSMIAFAGSAVAGEVGMPRRAAPREDGGRAEVAAPTPRQITKPEDESPIPY